MPVAALAALLLLLLTPGCGESPNTPITLIVSGSATGAEATVLARQLARFREQHPGLRVVSQPVPEAADQRHQLYVQWLNAGVAEPDVLQLDVVWLPEFAAAGWVLPLGRFEPDADDFFPEALRAARYDEQLYALPWFVDVGMLYFRSDVFASAPRTFDELRDQARVARARGFDFGFVWQGARYEGLVTVFQEYLGAFGGRIAADSTLRIEREPAVAALTLMRDSIHELGVVPQAVLTWQEEQTRFAFQSGRAAFMRNWPYAYALLEHEPGSRVAGRFGIAPMPSTAAGESTAALGGQQLAVNAHSRHPALAYQLIRFLTAPEQMLERAHVAGQLPARASVYADARFADAVPFDPVTVRGIVERAAARPQTPLYAELSEALQIELHRALTLQASPRQAIAAATERSRQILRRPSPEGGQRWTFWIVLGAAAGAITLAWLRRTKRRPPPPRGEATLAYGLVAPALLVTVALVLVPLAHLVWESAHLHDLRRPWLGREFVGFSNYEGLLTSQRVWGALGRTAAFASVSVSFELGLGLCMALLLNRAFRGRGIVRGLSLLPWTIPTVIAAMAFRFVFEARGGSASWLSHPTLAWVPVILADVWKTTPFVALLLLAGLQTIDPGLYDAAAIDGATRLQRFFAVTLPGLRRVILVTLLFRLLDAFRVFDLIYVLTHGGPGIATEPIAQFTWKTVLERLDFGGGAALSVIVFVSMMVLVVPYLRLLQPEAEHR